jgi:methionyl-tRNA formyltransferase
MGTPDFAVPALAALIEAGHDIVAVYCQPPRPAGRGQKERPSPVQAFAEGRRLAVRTPKSLRSPESQDEFRVWKADAAIVAAYGLILPAAILDAPRLGCFNIHASLLPRWRGAAPIQRAILAGDAETGITIMKMDQGLDTGAMLLQAAVAIGPEETAGTLHDRLGDLGSQMIVEALDGLVAGTLVPTPQPDHGVTYAAKIEKSEARIDWSRPASGLDRVVRAFAPWPGAWFEDRGTRIKVLAARIESGKGEPGTLLDSQLKVACGEGALRLLTLQREGKAPLAAEAFLRGYDLAVGRFG